MYEKRKDNTEYITFTNVDSLALHCQHKYTARHATAIPIAYNTIVENVDDDPPC